MSRIGVIAPASILAFVPVECKAQLISPPVLNSFGSYLSYGTIGLGLAIAVLAAALLTTDNQRRQEGASRFMLFGFSLVLVGTTIELVRGVQQNVEAERKFYYEIALPESLWDDFIFARTQRLFGKSEPTDERSVGSMKASQKKSLVIPVPKAQCRYYFAAVKPPATMTLSVAPSDMYHRQRESRDYYSTGKICSSLDTDVDGTLTLTVDAPATQYSITAYKAEPDAAQLPPAQPPTSAPLSELRRTVCTGEYEANCAGPHDIYIPCRPPADQAIAQSVCVGLARPNARSLRVHTKGGNNCGYSLIEVTCS